MALHIDEILTELDVPAEQRPGGATVPAPAPPGWQLLEQLRQQLALLLADDSRTQALGNDD